MRKRAAMIIAGAGLVVMAAGVAVQAHHAFAAEFDANRPVRLRGVITKMEWINPHSWIHIDVEDEGGEGGVGGVIDYLRYGLR